MSYKKFYKEVNQYIKDNEKLSIKTNEAELIIRDKWLEEKRYEELLSFVFENWDSGNSDHFSLEISDHFIQNKEVKLYYKLWSNTLSSRLNVLESSLWILEMKQEIQLNDILNVDMTGFNPFHSTELPLRRLAYNRTFLLNGITECLKGLEKLNETNDILEIKELEKDILILKSAFKSTRKKLKKPQKTLENKISESKMSEKEFWKIIENARKESENYNFYEFIFNKLENYSEIDLIDFQKILTLKMNELNTWDHWALAYIVRKGCGDDAFDYFRAWCVSKGEMVFNSIKNFEESKLYSIFENDDPQLEEFIYIIDDIFESKNKELPDLEVPEYLLNGLEWNEDNIFEKYSNLCKIFDFNP